MRQTICVRQRQIHIYEYKSVIGWLHATAWLTDTTDHTYNWHWSMFHSNATADLGNCAAIGWKPLRCDVTFSELGTRLNEI